MLKQDVATLKNIESERIKSLVTESKSISLSNLPSNFKFDRENKKLFFLAKTKSENEIHFVSIEDSVSFLKFPNLI